MSSARFLSALTQDQKEQVLEEATDEIVMRFGWYMDALEEALGLRKLVGEARLEAYRQRTPEAWAALTSSFPKEADKQRRDSEVLELGELRRSIKAVPEKSIIEQEFTPEALSAALTRFR